MYLRTAILAMACLWAITGCEQAAQPTPPPAAGMAVPASLEDARPVTDIVPDEDSAASGR